MQTVHMIGTIFETIPSQIIKCTCTEFSDYWIKLSNFIKTCIAYNTNTVDPIWTICKLITMLLLGCSRSGAPFRDVFSISVVLSLGAVLRLSNITPGGSEARVIGRNMRRKRDNKKNFKTHIICSIITSKDFLLVKIRK